jgi:hypothetical protein
LDKLSAPVEKRLLAIERMLNQLILSSSLEEDDIVGEAPIETVEPDLQRSVYVSRDKVKSILGLL